MRYRNLSLLALVPAAVVLAACSSMGGESTPTVTETVTSSSSTPSSSSVPSSSATPSSSPTPTSSSGSQAAGCASANLKGSVVEAAGGAAAGSEHLDIVLTNTSQRSCFLQGWPGVSLVTGGDGEQLGAAAEQDRSSAHATVTLAPGASAKALVTLAEAGNYSSAQCDPERADGFRVYPPGEKAAIFIEKSGITGCADDSVDLLTIAAVRAG